MDTEIEVDEREILLFEIKNHEFWAWSDYIVYEYEGEEYTHSLRDIISDVYIDEYIEIPELKYIIKLMDDSVESLSQGTEVFV